MSEELIQKGLIEHGAKLGNYELYNIGATSIDVLANYKIIPRKNYGYYGKYKPDMLVVDRRNTDNIEVLAVIEFKKTDNFNTRRKKQEAVEQCNTYCEILDAKIGIITDKQEYIWINPQIYFEKANYKYVAEDDIERGYDYIVDESDNQFIQIFDIVTEDGRQKFVKTLEKIEKVISQTNSKLIKNETINPKQLAKQVWQSVWLATGDDPKKCLMTFIELFIFKFLSDLGVLLEDEKKTRINFDEVFLRGEKACLKFYLEDVRDFIKDKFPESETDNTTIINGLSLRQEHNQGELFYNILDKFYKYGSLTNIDPEFKSRLFEEFLKGTTGKKQLAQFFTPRNVIKAIVEMAKVENLPDNSTILDPACGVGGFILETLIRRKQFNKNDFYFDSDLLHERISLKGHDYDEATIILAKANLLIFLSELLVENRSLTEKFADLFNHIFTATNKSIVGSLETINPNTYDLIMSNPPYITKGLSLYTNYIDKKPPLKEFYSISAQGKEGMFIQKMVKELRANGRAFIIVPDGFLYRPADTELRKFIRDECILDGIVSLPVKTFYTTTKKTYIICLTKKEDKSLAQNSPVFTYIVSDIGETLDVNRLPTPDLNDLKDMVTQYNYFITNKNGYVPLNNRCKIQDIELFAPENKWLIDEWWSYEEKVLLGIEDEYEKLTDELIFEKLEDLRNNIADVSEKLRETFGSSNNNPSYVSINFDDEKVFKINTQALGYNKKTYSGLDRGKGNGIPIYTATSEPVAYIDKHDTIEPLEATRSQPHISVATDGDGTAGTNIIYHTERYYLNTSRLSFEILDDNIDPQYVYCYIQDVKKKYSFDYRNKCNLTNFKNIEIKIPCDHENKFDLERQREFVRQYEAVKKLELDMTTRLFEEVKEFEGNFEDYLFESLKKSLNLL